MLFEIHGSYIRMHWNRLNRWPVPFSTPSQPPARESIHIPGLFAGAGLSLLPEMKLRVPEILHHARAAEEHHPAKLPSPSGQKVGERRLSLVQKSAEEDAGGAGKMGS